MAFQGLEVRQHLPLPAPGHGRLCIHPAQGLPLHLLPEGLKPLWRVQWWFGIGFTDNGSKPAHDRRPGAGGNGLPLALLKVPQVYVAVNKPWHYVFTTHINYLFPLFRGYIWGNKGNTALPDQDVRYRVQPGGRVNHMAVFEEEWLEVK